MRKSIVPILVGLIVSAAGAGAQAPSPVADALRADLKGAARNFTAAAEEMPADKYGFAPTKAQMTFGALVLHVASSNEFMCSRISGTKAPEEPKLEATSPKDQLVARVKRSFDYCTTALANLTDAGLNESVPYFGGRSVTRAVAVLGIAADWADHYGAAAGYLRLNGHLPPTARGRGGM
ncbi:MAG: DinB family protein [Gemmatimonadaceae bacterium]